MKIKLQFLGAAQNVTGSRYLLEARNKRLLIDCGLYQEREFQARNWEPFPVPADTIDAVLLTHAHLDHCGLLPKLVREGFGGPVYCTTATAEIARVVLQDSARIQVEDAEYKARRHQKEGRVSHRSIEPLYTPRDVDAVFPLFETCDLGTAILVADGIEITFQDSGHILGSSSIAMAVTDQGQSRRIVFSGDIGQWDRPIIDDPDPFDEADYILCESTYGDRLHGPGRQIKQELCDILTQAQQTGGNVVIPSFAIERSQELLYYLNELIRDRCLAAVMTFVDSPMAVKVTRIFKKHPELFDDEMTERVEDGESPFDLPGLTMVSHRRDSQAINLIRGSAVIIAGAGMCTGGRIKYHLRHNITRPECTILFVGYQATGTLGRRIVEGAPEVRIHGRMYTVRATVKHIHGFSAHADRDALLRWLQAYRSPKRVFITHGEPEAAASFAAYVTEQTGWKTSVPAHGDVVELD